MPKNTLFTLNQGFVYAYLYFLNEPQNNYNTNDMIIELATANFDIEQEIKNFNHKISTDEIFATHQRSWKEGIYVDDEHWATLKKTAAAILVENSEKSSKGAESV